jgi:hypothetical protein
LTRLASLVAAVGVKQLNIVESRMATAAMRAVATSPLAPASATPDRQKVRLVGHETQG